MAKGIDESTRMNSWGNDNDDYGYMPGIGPYQKGKFKKTKPEDAHQPPAKITSSMTWEDSEWYHDADGRLQRRTARYQFDENGNKIYLRSKVSNQI